MSVEDVVGVVATNLAHEALVELSNLWVLVGPPELGSLVDLVAGIDPLLNSLLGLGLGRATTADAAAWAGHNLDELDVGNFWVLSLDLLDELHGVGNALSDSNIDLETVEVGGDNLDAVGGASESGDVQVLHWLLGDHGVGSPDSSLHNTTRAAEDGGGTGTDGVAPVEFCVWEVLEVDLLLLEEPHEFAGGENDIDLFTAVLHLELDALDFVLLGNAWHDGDVDDLVWLEVLLLGPVGLDDATEHGHWRPAGGKVRDEFWGVLLDVVDPGWAAGGEHWDVTTLGKPLNEFVGLFDDGNVGSEVGVKDVVETELLESGDHLASADGTGWKAHSVAKVDTDGWGGLDNDGLAGLVSEDLLDFGDLVLLLDGAWAASEGALTALDASGILKWLAVGGADLLGITILDELEDALASDGLASLDAEAAGNALFPVEDKRVGGVIVSWGDSGLSESTETGLSRDC